jgi:lipopolysaccharide transport system ATP-binding protein
MESKIQFDHVSKRFLLQRERPRSFLELVTNGWKPRPSEQVWALQDVSFSVYSGETVGVVGDNGAGKSTLLKLITKVIAPSSGQIHVEGRVAALLELGAGFHPDLTGRENVFLNGSVLGIGRREMERKFDDMVAFSELDQFIDVPVKHYSSGMYMRLAFAVAIHVEPEVLLVDEVLAVGDQSFQAKCLQRVRELQHQGMTILFVSHELGTVSSLCSRVVWLEDGQVQLDGSVEQVLDAYRESVATHSPLAPGQRVAQPADVPGIRWGSGEVEITSVEFLGSDGQLRHVFTTGERMVVRMHHDARQRIAQPQVGLAFYHASTGTHLSGPNNVFSDYDIPYIEGEGYVDYIIPVLPFLAGDYFVSAAIYDHAGIHSFDHWHKCAHFTIKPGGVAEQYGLIYVPSQWDARVGKPSQELRTKNFPEPIETP